MSENTEKQVELGDKVVGQIELPSIDVSAHIGKKVPIEAVKEYEGSYGFYIKVLGKSVETIEQDGDKENIEVRPSRIFSLNTDKDGQIGWGEKTKLGLFLKKMEVDHYNKLVGKEVVCQSTTNKEGVDFLTFN